MYRPKRGTNRDANQKEIINAVRSLPFVAGIPVSIVDTSQAGGQILDVLLRVGRLTCEVEIKNGWGKPYTPDERAIFSTWTIEEGTGLRVVVHELQEMIDLITALAMLARALDAAIMESGAGALFEYLNKEIESEE